MQRALIELVNIEHQVGTGEGKMRMIVHVQYIGDGLDRVERNLVCLIISINSPIHEIYSAMMETVLRNQPIGFTLESHDLILKSLNLGFQINS